MRIGLPILTAFALGACMPYPQYPVVAPLEAAIPDLVGVIVAKGIAPAPPTFPGLLTLVGLGVAVEATAVDAVLVGPAPH